MTLEFLALFLGASLRLAFPLLLAGAGEYVSERAGVLNMSLEGMMLIGAFAAAAGSWASGDPLLGLGLAVVAVVPVALLQAVLSVTLRANQIVTGIGINVLALGATTLAYRHIFGARSREEIPGLSQWAPPGLSEIPVFGPAVFRQVWIVYPCFAIVALLAVVMATSKLGIIIRATGDEPDAVVRSGHGVGHVRYGAILFTGVMAALAGAFLSLGTVNTFTEGMTNGAGYLAIVAVIFGRWTLRGTVGAAMLFGASTALQFQLPVLGIDLPVVLLAMLPYVLALVAVGLLPARRGAPRALGQPHGG